MITLNRQKAGQVFNELFQYDIQKHLLKASLKKVLVLYNKYLIGEYITTDDLAKLSYYLVYFQTRNS